MYRVKPPYQQTGKKTRIMTTFSFEIDSSEVSKVKAILKALGAKKMKVKEDETKMSKEEFFAKLDHSIEQAKRGEVYELTPEQQKNLLGL